MKILAVAALLGCYLLLSATAEPANEQEVDSAADFDAANDLAEQNAEEELDPRKEATENKSNDDEDPFTEDSPSEDSTSEDDSFEDSLLEDSPSEDSPSQSEDESELESPNQADAKPGWSRRRRSRRRRSRRRRSRRRRSRRRRSRRRRSRRRRSRRRRSRRRRSRRRRSWSLGRRRRFFTRRYWKRKFFPECRRGVRGFTYRKGASTYRYSGAGNPCKNAGSHTSYHTLARCWAPRIYLAIGEKYKPSTVDYFLPHVKMVTSNGHSLYRYNMNAYNMPRGASNFFLRTKARLRKPTSKLWFFYGQNPSQAPVYVLHRQFTQNGKAVTDFVYWTFFPYNLGKEFCIGGATGGHCIGFCKSFGNHVADWEHVLVRLVNKKPSAMYVGAHNFGGTYLWHSASNQFRKGNDKLRFTADGHPIAYCAYGSHGMWSTNAEHVYKSTKNGEKLTDYTSTGTAWDTWKNFRLITYKRNGGYTGHNTWLNYIGRWGNKERGCGPFKLYSKIADECTLNSGPVAPNAKGVMKSNTLSKKK